MEKKKWLNSEKTQEFLINVFLLGAFVGGIATIAIIYFMSAILVSAL